jgi:hypothetical protein
MIGTEKSYRAVGGADESTGTTSPALDTICTWYGP